MKRDNTKTSTKYIFSVSYIRDSKSSKLSLNENAGEAYWRLSRLTDVKPRNGFIVRFANMPLFSKPWSWKVYAIAIQMAIKYSCYKVCAIDCLNSAFGINKVNLRNLITATGLVILLKLDSNRRFFSLLALEIWWLTSKNKAPLLYYVKLCA